MCDKRHIIMCKFEHEMLKQPIKRRMCAAKSLALSEPQASLPDSLQTKPCIDAVSCDEDLAKSPRHRRARNKKF